MEPMSAHITSYQNEMYHEVRDIFFESSTKKDFKDEKEKEDFYFKYLGFYLTRYPELAFVAKKDNKILGYVVGSAVSQNDELLILQPHLKVFKNFFKEYPAHLHINCHFESRGLGVGSQLVLEIEKQFKILKVSGMHIMTGPDASNQTFYRRLGFNFEHQCDFQGSAILFMGKKLLENTL
jgi:ribosomal protein S18 acetylase RimI-like enzyme